MSDLTAAQLAALRVLDVHTQARPTRRSSDPRLPYINATAGDALRRRGMVQYHLGMAGETVNITEYGRAALAEHDGPQWDVVWAVPVRAHDRDEAIDKAMVMVRDPLSDLRSTAVAEPADE